MTLVRCIVELDGSYVVQFVHRAAGMVSEIRHDPDGRYTGQTAHTGLTVQSLEEWDELRGAS